MDFALTSFAFTAGVLTFFSPCSVSLLPGYIAFVMGKDEGKSKLGSIKKGLFVGLSASVGFFLVFIILGTLAAVASEVVGRFLPWVQLITGILILALGVAIFFDYRSKIKLNFQFKFLHRQAQKGNGLYAYFFYGVGYALTALSCTLPVFLGVLFQAVGSGGAAGAILIFVAYALGMSVLMIGVSVLSVVAKDLIREKLVKAIPFVTKISAIVLIQAGIYLINFSWTTLSYVL